jgi:ABC-type methionine transport system ATPase subunit
VSAPSIVVRVKLTFPESLVRVPVIARLVRQFDVEANIRRANVEEHQGWILCELEGEADDVEAAVGWLRAEGVGVDLLGDVLEG